MQRRTFEWIVLRVFDRDTIEYLHDVAPVWREVDPDGDRPHLAIFRTAHVARQAMLVEREKRPEPIYQVIPNEPD